MPEVARKGDSVNTGHPCDPVTTLATPSQSKVFMGDSLVCCKGDKTVPHEIDTNGSCLGVIHTASISGSSNKVYVGNSLVARKGDSCDSGSISSGSSKIIVG